MPVGLDLKECRSRRRVAWTVSSEQHRGWHPIQAAGRGDTFPRLRGHPPCGRNETQTKMHEVEGARRSDPIRGVGRWKTLGRRELLIQPRRVVQHGRTGQRGG